MSELIVKNHIIDASIEEILKCVKKELTNGKLKVIQSKGDQVKVTCPHHSSGLEKNADCYVNASKNNELEYGYYHCFACGDSGRLTKFIGECFDASESFGEDWLLERFGQNLVVESQIDFPDFSEFETKHEEYLDESILNTMQSYHPYMDKRKLSRKVCEVFKVKYEPSSKCLVFPVYDENDKLYMLTRRSVETKQFIIDANKEKPVYLYNYIKKKNIEEVTIVESQINALTLWSWGYPSVALFGTGTQHQYDLLNNSSIKHYYLCFDGDGAGTKGIQRFLKNIRKDVFVDVIVMKKGKDVNDLTQEEFENLQILDAFDWQKLQK